MDIIGPSSAPRKPPLWISFFFLAWEVFFRSIKRRCFFFEDNFFFWAGFRGTLPFKRFRTHSTTQLIKSPSQCLCNKVRRVFGLALCRALSRGACWCSFDDILMRMNEKCVCYLLLFRKVDIRSLVGKNIGSNSKLIVSVGLQVNHQVAKWLGGGIPIRLYQKLRPAGVHLPCQVWYLCCISCIFK